MKNMFKAQARHDVKWEKIFDQGITNYGSLNNFMGNFLSFRNFFCSEAEEKISGIQEDEAGGWII